MANHAFEWGGCCAMDQAKCNTDRRLEKKEDIKFSQSRDR
jgi:hypothetical protein